MKKSAPSLPITVAPPSLGAYLDDSAFHADWEAALPFAFSPQGRNALLAGLVRGRRVVHLGFADHGPLIEAKRAQGVWLHDAVLASAQAAMGVDINEEAVNFARSLGVPDLHAVDVHSAAMEPLCEAFGPEAWLLPDVLEHLHEPVRFIQRLRTLAPSADLIISVPNGLSLRNTLNALRGMERINTDHLCWYSPFTALKLLRRGGYAHQALWCSQIAPAGTWKGRLSQSLIRHRPVWADNLVVARPV